MKRLHLFEFEDQPWCPSFIRETTTDFLFTLYHLKNIYAPALKKIHEVLEKSEVNTIVDCCSGSGGPIKQLREYLDNNGNGKIHITLTDKYPNEKLLQHITANYSNNNMTVSKDSVDATCLPPSLKGMRTLFSSFHHFKPKQAITILQNAVDHHAPIGIFECTQRHPTDFIRMLFSPFFLWCIIPFSGRLTWKKFIFTYLLPITPFTNMWDFLVSILRTYSPKQLQNLIKQVNAPSYHWETGKLWSAQAKCHIIYLIGYPKTQHLTN